MGTLLALVTGQPSVFTRSLKRLLIVACRLAAASDTQCNKNKGAPFHSYRLLLRPVSHVPGNVLISFKVVFVVLGLLLLAWIGGSEP